jgi:uncharacterized protein
MTAFFPVRHNLLAEGKGMKTSRGLALAMILFCGLAFLLPDTGFCQAPVRLKFASHSLGSSWYLLGAAMTELLKKNLPAGSNIDLLPYAAGVGNPKLISKGEADCGLGVNVTNKWAYEGKVAYDTKMTNLRGLLGGLDTYWLGVMVRSKVEVNSFEELKKKKYPLKMMLLTPGSMGELGARQIMEAYGISAADIKSWGGSVTNTSFEVIVSAMQDGRTDCFIQVITPGHPSVMELAVTTGIKFLPLSEEVIGRLGGMGWDSSVIPAGTFKGQDKDVRTVGFSSGVIVTDKFPQDVAYLLTKIVNENKDPLVKVYNAVKVFDPQTAWQESKNRIPLHPAAVRYYKEKKWMP